MSLGGNGEQPGDNLGSNVVEQVGNEAVENEIMQENNDANQQHSNDDAIDEEENGHEEQLNDNANVTLSKMLSNKLRGTGVAMMVARGTTVQI